MQSQPVCLCGAWMLWFCVSALVCMCVPRSVELPWKKEKVVLLKSVSMYFAELLCLHFLVFTCCSHVKSIRLWGKGQSLLHIIIERNKNAEKCQEILMNMFLRELEKKPSHKVKNQIQIPYPSASPLRGWKIQNWNTTSLNSGVFFVLPFP